MISARSDVVTPSSATTVYLNVFVPLLSTILFRVRVLIGEFPYADMILAFAFATKFNEIVNRSVKATKSVNVLLGDVMETVLAL